MKSFKAVLTLSLLVFYLMGITLFSCGCDEPYADKSKIQHHSILSEGDSEFQQGIDRPPTVRTLYSMAKIFIYQQRYDEAESLLQRVINQNPKFIPAYNDLAEIKVKKRRTNEAIEILSKALNENSSDSTALNNLGMCWMIRKDYEKALQMFTKAAGLEPDNTRYRANMAVALGMMGRDSEALTLYRQILPEQEATKNLDIIKKARTYSPVLRKN